MTTIADVRDALAAAITSGSGLRCTAYELDQVNAPCAHVNRAPMDPRMVMGATKNVYQFRVTVFANLQSDVAAQKQLDVLCAPAGAGSVRAAVENGDMWPVSVDYAAVTLIGDAEERAARDGATYLATDIDVEVVW